MGTITDKLNWLLGKKRSIINELNNKWIRAGASPLNLNMSLSALSSVYSNTKRVRLVPVLTFYMPYSYGVSGGVTAYYPLKYYTTPYTWANNIIDKSYATVDNTDLTLWGSQAPVLTREEKGVITGTLPAPPFTYEHLFPFVIGGSVWDNVSNETNWRRSPAYTSLSSYYSSNRWFKTLIADDTTKNDGQFILGAIALIDPLKEPQVSNYALPYLNTFIVNSSYIHSDNYNQGFSQLTATRIEEGRFRVTLPYGYNIYDKLTPVISGTIDSIGNPHAMHISIKSFIVNASSSTLEVTIADDASRNDGGFFITLFGYRK